MHRPAVKSIDTYSSGDLDVLEDWWVQKARANFFAFRRYMRCGDFVYNWFVVELCSLLQTFYLELVDGARPILIISTPPQHGKSWLLGDFISWLIGKNPIWRTIYGSYSDTLGTRCNLHVQRFMDSPKYQKIFPNVKLAERKGTAIRNNSLLEYMYTDTDQVTGGQFRNTTVAGGVTGESLDLGVLDDPLKGREQANSPTYRDKIWDWFTDDFNTRFSEYAGLLIVTTRWHVDDPVARLIKKKKTAKIYNFPAFATKDEKHRKEDDPLFPELKSKEFLEGKKDLLNSPNWESLYQGNPTIPGGNIFKDKWWGWWKVLPKLKYTFIVADTAQKAKTIHDFTCFQCWGYGVDDCIYLLAQLHAKFESPELRKEAEIFYNANNHKKKHASDPVLRGFYIEDKSSGSGLIQELKKKRVKVIGVQRSVDKVLRSSDTAPEIEAGKVFLNVKVAKVGVITQEAREFPNGEFDDAIDTTMNAIETAILYRETYNSLKEAMGG